MRTGKVVRGDHGDGFVLAVESLEGVDGDRFACSGQGRAQRGVRTPSDLGNRQRAYWRRGGKCMCWSQRGAQCVYEGTRHDCVRGYGGIKRQGGAKRMCRCVGKAMQRQNQQPWLVRAVIWFYEAVQKVAL